MKWERPTPDQWYLAQIAFWVYMVYYSNLMPEEGRKEKDPPVFTSPEDMILKFTDKKPEKKKTAAEIKKEEEEAFKERIAKSKMFWMGNFYTPEGKLKTRTPPQKVDPSQLERRDIPPHPATERINDAIGSSGRSPRTPKRRRE